MGPSNLGDISFFFSFTVLKVVRNKLGVCGKLSICKILSSFICRKLELWAVQDVMETGRPP